MRPNTDSTCCYLHNESDISNVTAFIDMISNAYILGGGKRSDLSVSLDGDEELRVEISYITDDTAEKGGIREGEYLYKAVINPISKAAYKELTSFLRYKKLPWYLIPGNAEGWGEHTDFDIPLHARLQLFKFGYEGSCND